MLNRVCQLGRGAWLRGTGHCSFIKTDVLACVVRGPHSATPTCPPPSRGFSHDGSSAGAHCTISSFPGRKGPGMEPSLLPPVPCCCSCHPVPLTLPDQVTKQTFLPHLPPAVGPWGWSHPPRPFSKPTPPSTLSASLVAGADQAPCGRAHLCGSGLGRVGVQAAAAVYRGGPRAGRYPVALGSWWEPQQGLG